MALDTVLLESGSTTLLKQNAPRFVELSIYAERCGVPHHIDAGFLADDERFDRGMPSKAPLRIPVFFATACCQILNAGIYRQNAGCIRMIIILEIRFPIPT